MVKPLRVVDEADQGLLVADHRHQAQHRQSDQESIRRWTGTQAERGAESVALRPGQVPEVIQRRRAELMQPGVGKFHLGFDSGRPEYPATCRTPRQVFQERGLSDASLTAQDQHLAATGPHGPDQSAQRLALALAAVQPINPHIAGHPHRRR